MYIVKLRNTVDGKVLSEKEFPTVQDIFDWVSHQSEQFGILRSHHKFIMRENERLHRAIKYDAALVWLAKPHYTNAPFDIQVEGTKGGVRTTDAKR